MKHALKVKQTVKQEIESLISNPTRLLRVLSLPYLNLKERILKSLGPSIIIQRLPIPIQSNGYYRNHYYQPGATEIQRRIRLLKYLLNEAEE